MQTLPNPIGRYKRSPKVYESDRDALSLGQRIRLYRQRAGKTQRQLATEIGWNNSWLNRIERDRVDNLRVKTLVRLAAALGVSCGALLD